MSFDSGARNDALLLIKLHAKHWCVIEIIMAEKDKDHLKHELYGTVTLSSDKGSFFVIEPVPSGQRVQFFADDVEAGVSFSSIQVNKPSGSVEPGNDVGR